ncbi:MAG TPA: flagellar hook-length control protein FliK [Tepidisphaeraceae bacterium]|nr:flagellar hook-length control protein FliK [Tepidisphaeraceae bacterium]
MKVQELLSRSELSGTSCGTRSTAPEAKSSDFAGALTQARKKPEPKGAETGAPDASEMPAARKSAAAKKCGSARNQAAPAEDSGASESSAPADQAHAPAAVDGDQPLAEADESLETDDAEPTAEPTLPTVDANPSAITMTPIVGPQALPAPDLSIAADAPTTDDADPITSPPNVPSQARPTLARADADAATVGIPLDLDQLSAADGGDQLALAPDDAQADPALIAPAPAKRPPAPVVAVDNGEPPDPDSTAHDDPNKQPLPRLISAFPLAEDSAADAMASSSAADAQSDVTTTPTASSALHVPAEPAKPQLTSAAPPAPAPPPPQAHFAEANHSKIVTAVQTQMLSNGGSMQIRLDPPELGALQVRVHMQDGVMTASFHTSNDDATRLLSHSLSQLKAVLESQGVSVEKLQVQQSPKDQHAGNDNEPGRHPRDQHDDAHRQEQQRKDMLRRMWRKLANGSDPLDLVA